MLARKNLPINLWLEEVLATTARRTRTHYALLQ